MFIFHKTEFITDGVFEQLVYSKNLLFSDFIGWLFSRSSKCVWIVKV